MAKVYVSSTVADLKSERQAVMDWLVAAGHQPVHSYRPDSESVRDSCLDDVDTCDLYVLILGHRYGAQPGDGNLEELPITQLEFRRAGRSGIPRVVLLRMSIPDVSVSNVEDPQKLRRVLAFRDEAGRAVRPTLFKDKGGLIQALSTGVQAELAKRTVGTEGAGRALRLAPRPPLLAGREELLAEVEARLAGGGVPGPRTVMLSGLGGAGKTSVAVEYAHRHLDEAGVAWQFAAQDVTVLAAGFTDLAAQLGVTAGARGGDPVALVHSVLAAYPGTWLLVFDNAPDQVSVAGFVPPARAGRVLITSQNALWPRQQLVEVPVLKLDVAAEFLAERTGDLDGEAAADLARELGGLPLALEQATAYIQATGDSLVGYLESFRRRRADLLARGKAGGYSGTVATSWGLAFTQLEASVPAAAGLLRLLAFCAPEAVPLGLLLRHRPELARRLAGEVAEVLVPLLKDELAAKDAVAALRRYSLVRPAGEGAVSVHRLVQAVTADQMPGQLREAWRQAAAALVEAALPDDPRQRGTWPVFAALLPHAQAALLADSGKMTDIASYLGYSGGYVAARDFSRAMLAERAKVRGAEHPDTLVVRAHQASWTGMTGDAAGARDQYAVLLPIVERVLGPEHPNTLIIRANLAYYTVQAGDAAGARVQDATLLPTVERVLGPEPPDTLTTRGNLAYWRREAGDDVDTGEN